MRQARSGLCMWWLMPHPDICFPPALGGDFRQKSGSLSCDMQCLAKGACRNRALQHYSGLLRCDAAAVRQPSATCTRGQKQDSAAASQKYVQHRFIFSGPLRPSETQQVEHAEIALCRSNRLLWHRGADASRKANKCGVRPHRSHDQLDRSRRLMRRNCQKSSHFDRVVWCSNLLAR